MRTGKLRHRVAVKQYTLASDGAGGTTVTESEPLTTWANIIPIRGQRLFQLNQIVQGTWYDIQMRYREDLPITKDLKLDHSGKVITIHSVIVKDERNKVLELTGYTND